MTYQIVLVEDAFGGPATPQLAFDFADGTGASVPVTSDLTKQVITATPWALQIPGKCVLSPRMEILTCYGGTNDNQGLEAIQAHLALQP